MMAFLSPILGFFGKLFEGIMQHAPVIVAFFAGKKAAEAKVTENNLEAKIEAEEEGQKTRDELREKPVSDYIRKNDI